MRLALARLSEDDYGLLHLQLLAQAGNRVIWQDFYAYPNELREFGAKLEAFPSSVDDVAVFEYGSKDRMEEYCWAILKAYVYDAKGHSALEVGARNNLDPPAQASGSFSVALEAAALNRLGAELVAWSQSKKGDLEFENRDV